MKVQYFRQCAEIAKTWQEPHIGGTPYRTGCHQLAKTRCSHAPSWYGLNNASTSLRCFKLRRSVGSVCSLLLGMSTPVHDRHALGAVHTKDSASIESFSCQSSASLAAM